jgi:hypothetical protein
LRVEKAERAPDCPDAPSLADAIATSIGHPAVSLAPQADTQDALEVDFSRTGADYVATIRTQGSSSGVRTLSDSGPTCVGLGDAVAVALVLLLDERAQVRLSPVESGLEPATEPESPSRVNPTRPREKPAWAALQFDGSAILSTGILGAFAPGISADVQWNPRRAFALDLGVLWFPSQSFRLPPGIVQASLLAGRISACAVPIRRPITLGVCVAPWLGALEGSSTGFSVNDSGRTAPWFGLAGGVVLGGPFRGVLGWTGRAEVVVPVMQRGFAVPGAGEAYAQAPAALVVALGGRLSIP